MVLAQRPLADQLTRQAKEFINVLETGDVEKLWNQLISIEAVELVSITALPLLALKADTLENFFANSDLDQLGFGFQIDAANTRSGFLSGLAGSLAKLYRENFDGEDSYVFVSRELNSAVFAAPGKAGKDVFVLFCRDTESGTYVLDLVGLLVFAMHISASKIYQLGMQALEFDEEAAIRLFEVCASLKPVYDRLRKLVWGHHLLKNSVTADRKGEIQAEYRYIALAQEQAQILLTSQSPSLPIDLASFMRETFAGYDKIAETPLDDVDRRQLNELPEEKLRIAIAELLRGVDPNVAQREAGKPHTGYEISDMDLVVHYHGRDFNLSIPMKSGPEMATRRSVPVDVFHQLLRPHMAFNYSVVVFITVKPCSQPLQNYIHLARSRFGATIEVIQADELAKLLKLGGMLAALPA